MMSIAGSIADFELSQTMDGSLDYFLTALNGGSETLSGFLQHLSSFNDTVKSHQNQLKGKALTDAHTLASTIGSISSMMLELETHTERLQSELEKEISHILNDDMEDLVIRDEFPVSTAHNSTPSYIRPCSQWLLANLHNPYPPKSVRNSICRQAACSAKDVDAWFTDARKRVGWNQLRRTHFSNKREKIINAAMAFFKPSPEFLKVNPFPRLLPLDHFKDHSMAFVEMEECARRLFSEKFEETPLARTIDQTDTENTTFKRRPNGYGYGYPSPERSPERSPEPSSPSNVDILGTPSPSVASHKRRRSVPEACIDDTSPDRPSKRIRSTNTHYSDNILAAASLPSPAASLNEVSPPTGHNVLPLTSTAATFPPTLPAFNITQGSSAVPEIPSAKRKRSSSDSEDRRPSKHPQIAYLSRIASDPRPLPSQLLHISSLQNLSPDYGHNPPLLFDISPGSNEVANTADLDIHYQYSLPSFMPNDPLNPAATLQDLTSHLQETGNLSPSSEPDAWAEGLREYELHDLMMTENSIYTNNLSPLILEPDFFTGMPALEKFFDPTSSAIDWTGFLNQPLDTQIASQVELGTVFNEPASVLTSICPPTTTELAAKRQRAEILRAELRQLEADLD